jgi:hypothetical protein
MKLRVQKQFKALEVIENPDGQLAKEAAGNEAKKSGFFLSKSGKTREWVPDLSHERTAGKLP